MRGIRGQHHRAGRALDRRQRGRACSCPRTRRSRPRATSTARPSRPRRCSRSARWRWTPGWTRTAAIRKTRALPRAALGRGRGRARRGRVDAAIVDNPAYAQALADGSLRTVTRVYTAIAKQFFLGVWFATGSYLAAKPQRCGALLARDRGRRRRSPAPIPTRRSTTSRGSPSKIATSSRTCSAPGSARRRTWPTSSRSSTSRPSITSSPTRFPAADLVSDAAAH